jgi:flagellar hook protein FlgE
MIGRRKMARQKPPYPPMGALKFATPSDPQQFREWLVVKIGRNLLWRQCLVPMLSAVLLAAGCLSGCISDTSDAAPSVAMEAMAQPSLYQYPEYKQDWWDVTVCGDGFFEWLDGQGQRAYTRSASFMVDAEGSVRNESGWVLMGLLADRTGVIDPGLAKPLTVPTVLPPAPTTLVTLRVNLDSRSAITAPASGSIPRIDFTNPATYNDTSSLTVYDSNGQTVALTFYYQKVDNDSWNVFASIRGKPVNGTTADPQPIYAVPINFLPDGSAPVADLGALSISLEESLITSGGAGVATAINFKLSLNGVTQYGSGLGFDYSSQDGHAAVRMSAIWIQPDGIVESYFGNGPPVLLAQVALVNFSEPTQLEKVAPGVWRPNSRTGSLTRMAPMSARSCGLQFYVLERPGPQELSNSFPQAKFGAFAATEQPLDAAICGGGFFEFITDRGRRQYSRDGRFSVGSDAIVRNSVGLMLMGHLADAGGNIDMGPPTPLKLDPATFSALLDKSTRHVVLSGNLDPVTQPPTTLEPLASKGDHQIGVDVNLSMVGEIFNETGEVLKLNLLARKVATDLWNFYGDVNGIPLRGAPTNLSPLTDQPLAFLADGSLRDPGAAKLRVDLMVPVLPDSSVMSNVKLEISLDQLTQKVQSQSGVSFGWDGTRAGWDMQHIVIYFDGTLWASFSNSPSRALGQITLATFDQPAAMTNAGSGLWNRTPAAGAVSYSVPGSASNCGLQPGVRQVPHDRAPPVVASPVW